MLKAIVAGIVVVGAAAVGTVTGYLSQPKARPSIATGDAIHVFRVNKADPQTVALGTLQNHRRHEYKYRLANDSATKAEIGSFSTSCDCFSVKAANTTLLPGEETVLYIVFDFEGHPGTGSLMLSASCSIDVGAASRILEIRMGVDIQ
jgi:Protein of unknown function (DUF1573)